MKFSFLWFFSTSSSAPFSLSLSIIVCTGLFSGFRRTTMLIFSSSFSLCQGQKVFISSSSAHMENPYHVSSFHGNFPSFVEVFHWKMLEISLLKARVTVNIARKHTASSEELSIYHCAGRFASISHRADPVWITTVYWCAIYRWIQRF